MDENYLKIYRKLFEQMYIFFFYFCFYSIQLFTYFILTTGWLLILRNGKDRFDVRASQDNIQTALETIQWSAEWRCSVRYLTRQ